MAENCTTVPMSQVAASGRLDAGYHLALARAAKHMPMFADLLAPEAITKAQDLVNAAPKEVLVSALGPLERGAAPASITRSRALDVAAAYPHLSLALLHKYLPEIVRYQGDQLKQAQKTMNTVMDFASDYPEIERTPSAPRKPGR